MRSTPATLLSRRHQRSMQAAEKSCALDILCDRLFLWSSRPSFLLRFRPATLGMHRVGIRVALELYVSVRPLYEELHHQCSVWCLTSPAILTNKPLDYINTNNVIVSYRQLCWRRFTVYCVVPRSGLWRTAGLLRRNTQKVWKGTSRMIIITGNIS